MSSIALAKSVAKEYFQLIQLFQLFQPCFNIFFFFLHLPVMRGGLAQLARACGWQPQGQGFDSPNLHPCPPKLFPSLSRDNEGGFRIWCFVRKTLKFKIVESNQKSFEYGVPRWRSGWQAIWRAQGGKKWRFDTKLRILEAFICESPLLPPCNNIITMSFRAKRGISRNRVINNIGTPIFAIKSLLIVIYQIVILL